LDHGAGPGKACQGCSAGRRRFPTDPELPEIDPLNFAPGHDPVLMINGRYDFDRPEYKPAASVPAVGTPPADKQNVLFDAGHVHRETR